MRKKSISLISNPASTLAATLAIFVSLLALTAAGCGEDLANRKNLSLSGSSTVQPVMQEIARRFESLHPQYRIDVQLGGSSRGVSDAKNGVVNIGMASRALKANEQDGLLAHPIAVDGICLVSHRDNPVDSLTDEQVRKIYRGEIKNWKEIGGTDAKIIVLNKAEGRGTLEVFLKYFGLKIENIKADLIVGDNQQAIKTITSTPTSLGYVSVGAADFEVKNGGKIKLMKANGVQPSLAAVQSGEFPITRPLILITKGEPDPDAAALIRFARSQEVHDLIEGQYFVPSTK